MSTKLKRKTIELILNELMAKQIALPMNDFFELFVESLTSSVDTSNDTHIGSHINSEKLTSFLYAYFFYFRGFTSAIQSIHPHKYKDILFKLAEILRYETLEGNRLLMRYGDKGSKFYFILKGSVDIVLLIEKEASLTKLDYLRYLAYLIGYKEYEMLDKVITANIDNYPLFITDSTGYSKFNSISKGIAPPQYIEINELFEVLTKEEQIVLRPGFEESMAQVDLKEERVATSTINYIERLKQYESKGKELPQRWDNEVKLDFTLFEYLLVTSLSSGEMFGDMALSDLSNRRTATVITSEQCHFGTVSKDHYELFLKGINDQIKKENISYLLSCYVFQGIASSLIQKRYYSYFVMKNISKGHKVFIQHGTSNDILFLRHGFYEVSAHLSYEKLLQLINYLNSIIQQPEYKLLNKGSELGYQITEMNEFNKRIVARAKEDKSMSDFYHQTEQYNILSLNAPDIIGFRNLYSEENTMLYSFELRSQEGSYFSFSKDIYEQMCCREPKIRQHELKYVKMKIKKMLRRLLFLHSSKLEIYFKHNPDYIYFKEYSGKKKVDLMKDILHITTTPKENQPKFYCNCLSTKKIINRSENSIEVNKEKEKSKKRRASLLMQYVSPNQPSPFASKNAKSQLNTISNSRISTGNWMMMTRNNKNQTSSLNNSNSNTIGKGYVSHNETSNTRLSSVKSKQNNFLPFFPQANKAKNRFLFLKSISTEKEGLKADKEEKDPQDIQQFPKVCLEYSLSPSSSTFKIPLISRIDNILFKKKRYLDQSQQNNLKNTRNQVVRFLSKYSLSKKKIGLKKKA